MAEFNLDGSRKILHIEESLIRFGGDTSLYKELLSDFLLESRFPKIEFEKNLNNKNYTELKHLAHKLKGVSGTIGAELLYDELKSFEETLLLKDGKKLQAKISHIQKTHSLTISTIKEYLQLS